MISCFEICPLLLGSGKFATPCERTQLEKAREWEFGDWEFTDSFALEPIDDG